MLDAAQRAHILYDPRERLDAMHSALFTGRNVAEFRLPFMGGALQSELMALDLLPDILRAVAEDTLDTATFARLMRARREHPPYLRSLLAQLDAAGPNGLTRMLCRNVVARMNAPRFRRRLAQQAAESEAARTED